MKTLIVGLGNPILSDDGVGVWVARALAQSLNRMPAYPSSYSYSFSIPNAPTEDEEEYGCDIGGTDIVEASVGGLRLMEMLVGYERAILIDACTTGDDPAGTVRRLTLADLEALSPTQHTASAHDTTLLTALATGRRMGLPLPDDIIIFALRAANVSDFSAAPTPAVAAAIPLAVAAVLAELAANDQGLMINHRPSITHHQPGRSHDLT